MRENTEGVYAGEGGFLRKGTPNEVATQGSVNTRLGVERCVRFAFDLARSRDPAAGAPRHVTLVHKTNVLTFAGDLWQRTFDDVASEYGDVSTGYQHVDAACIHLVQDPGRYDVIVTDNLFGDILTDLAGALAGGIGLAASANLNPDRSGPSLFEPVHGSAPDIAGAGTAICFWNRERAVLDAPICDRRAGLAVIVPAVEGRAVEKEFPARGGFLGGHVQVEAPGMSHAVFHVVYQPESHFWPLQLTETGLFVGLAATLILFAAWWTKQRTA